MLDFSQPGKPPHNACIQSFNRKFRVECLNQHRSLIRDGATRKWRNGI